jgi:hypothetical protein
MSLSATHFVSLGERVRSAQIASPALIADVIARDRGRSWPATGSKRLEQLIRIGAWTDAALQLIELELPQWKVRRLVYDDGQWCCALSRQRELPDWLDKAVEGHHATVALAILSALIEARLADDTQATAAACARRGASTLFEPMLSDNFA